MTVTATGNDRRFADFDAAFAELDAKPLVVKLFGREWELPPTISAAAVLKVARWMADGRAEHELTGAELTALAADLIPSTVLDEWLARGLDLDRLGPIVRWVCEQYMGDMPGATPGEASAPTVGAHTSSSGTGGSSKPTSPANTVSTFREPYAR